MIPYGNPTRGVALAPPPEQRDALVAKPTPRGGGDSGAPRFAAPGGGSIVGEGLATPPPGDSKIFPPQVGTRGVSVLPPGELQ